MKPQPTDNQGDSQDWLLSLRERLQPFVRSIVDSRLFREMAEGTLSMKRFRGALLYFYPLVENFPKYMGVTLTKVPEGDSPRNNLAREWLLENMNVERRHAHWYRQWAVSFGVSGRTLNRPVVPPPEMDAINNYLWRVTSHGSLAEALAAVNFGVEGPTGIWSKEVERNARAYAGKPGVSFGKETLFWLKAHAAYDDRHPEEALELIKLFAMTKAERRKVMSAAKRSMEYYALAAEACYEIFA